MVPEKTDVAMNAEVPLLIHASEPSGWQTFSEMELEFKFCVAAIPLALICAMLFDATGLGAMLQRKFLDMPVHELGHAGTGWFCGFTTIPIIWKTLILEKRGFIAPMILAGAFGYLMFRAWQVHNQPLL